MGIEYSISAITDIVKGVLYSGNGDSASVNELSIDSRRLSHPEKTLFVALINWKSHSFTMVFPLLPVIPMTGMLN